MLICITSAFNTQILYCIQIASPASGSSESVTTYSDGRRSYYFDRIGLALSASLNWHRAGAATVRVKDTDKRAGGKGRENQTPERSEKTKNVRTGGYLSLQRTCLYSPGQRCLMNPFILRESLASHFVAAAAGRRRTQCVAANCTQNANKTANNATFTSHHATASIQENFARLLV